MVDIEDWKYLELEKYSRNPTAPWQNPGATQQNHKVSQHLWWSFVASYGLWFWRVNSQRPSASMAGSRFLMLKTMLQNGQLVFSQPHITVESLGAPSLLTVKLPVSTSLVA